MGVACSLLTRNATKLEKSSQEAREAWNKELGNFRLHSVWDTTPIARADVNNKAKIFPLLGLTSVKHAERGVEEQTMKARLVGRGDIGTHPDGSRVVEHEDMWAPVASLASVRLVLALSILLNRPVQSLDVTSAYLQAPLRTDDEYYVILPSDVVCLMTDEEQDAHFAVDKPVYRLRKALYGLQRSAFDWISTMIEHLAKRGWSSSAFDPALMTRQHGQHREMLCLYVDDVLLLTTQDRFEYCWSEVLMEFQASEPTPCTEYIGVRFPVTEVNARACMEVDMRDYTSSIVRDLEKECGPVKYSLAPLSAEGVKEMLITRDEKKESTLEKKQVKRVQGYIGRLMWLARTGRPDISHSVTLLASMVNSWGPVAEKEMVRLVGYLKHTQHDTLTYQIVRQVTEVPDTSVMFRTYVDASLQEPRSYSGGAITVGLPGVGECLIEWWSRRQRICATSSMLAEIIAMMEGVVEAAPLREFSRYPVRILCDNQSAIRVASQGYSKAIAAYTRPLRLRMLALKDLVELEQIEIQYVPTKDNMADLFTKTFARFEQARLSRLAGMRGQGMIGKETNPDGTWVVPDPDEEAGAAKEKRDQKLGYIREAKRERRENGDSSEGAEGLPPPTNM
jgi:hypothetical protein